MQEQAAAENPAFNDGAAKRDNLIRQYRKYVHSVVGRLIHILGLPSEMYDEFVGAGYLGLVEAAERFNPQTGNDFRCYAFLRIRGAIIDNIRATSNISGKAYRYAKALQSAQNIRQAGGPMRNKHASQWTNDGPDRMAGILEFAAQSALAFRLSLHDAESELGRLEQTAFCPQHAAEKREIETILGDLVAKLPAKERTIIEGFYFKDKSFSEIALENPGLSKSWISRLHVRGLSLLKELYVEYLERSNQSLA